MKVIEETLKKCKRCGETATHIRSNSKSSGAAIVIHIFLAIVTAGIWLLLLLAWMILTTKIGGWHFKECGE